LTEINLEGPCQNIDVAVRELEIWKKKNIMMLVSSN
jgi:hypothetical protein